ncbi:MAG: energy transducer TonB [Bacteroidota bacterium]|nr:energy transducer TonB [Bacteroidota bacterium]
MKRLTLNTRIRFMKCQSFGFGVLYALTRQKWFFERKISTGIILLSLMNLLATHHAFSKNQYNISKKGTTSTNSTQQLNDTTINQPIITATCYEVYTPIEEMPEYPGGNDSLRLFIRNNTQYPANAVKQKIEGRVIVQFTVNTDGSISEVIIVRSIDPELDAEAIRLIHAMPKWEPAKQQNQPVQCRFTVPINFTLPKGTK